MTDEKNIDREDEQDIALLLKAVGSRDVLPPNLQARWEKRFREELNRKLAENRKRSVRRFAVAACVMVIGFMVALPSFRNHQSEFPLITVVATGTTQPGLEVNSGAAKKQRLKLGQVLSDQDYLETQRNEYVSIDYDGFDVRLFENTHVQFSGQDISLLRGRMYVNSDTGKPKLRNISVVTPQSTITNLGTQFTISYSEGQTVATVRRGALLVETASDVYEAVAEIDQATRVMIGERLNLEVAAVAPYGSAWNWIYHADVPFVLEGSTALEFLQWSANESGRRLVFRDDFVEAYASTAVLHGDLGDLDPEAALAPVLSAIELDFVIENNLLEVYRSPRY